MLRMTFEDAAAKGMVVAWHAAREPDRLAISSEQGDRTFSELNAQANRLVELLRGAGLVPGDGVAHTCHAAVSGRARDGAKGVLAHRTWPPTDLA